MNLNRSVFWQQGLLLQPQHFQQTERYFQSVMIPYQKFIQPHLWGIGDIEIQTSALGNRSFRITRGEFLFPDGTFVALPGNALIEIRSFKEDWLEGSKPLPVYLGLRRLNETGDNVTVSGRLDHLSEITTRFATSEDEEEVGDIYQSGPTARMRRLFYVLKVFWGNEIQHISDYEVIPVARIERTGDEILLSGRYVPPCLNLAGSDTLMKIVREIRDQIAARGNQLETYKQSRGIQTAEFGARDMVYLLALRSLNRYSPLLSHLIQEGQTHPWAVYGVIRQLIGELSTFSLQVNAMGETDDRSQTLLSYDHRHLWSCFAGAQALVIRLLDEITAGPEYIVELLYDGTYFAADLAPAMFEGRNRYYLVCETEEDPQPVIDGIESIAKLGSRETLPILIARALQGVKLSHRALPPQELPRRSHAVYFQIDHHSDHWAQVEKTHNIAFYWDTAPQDIKLEMMIVGGS
jgi:type VI secretion system protein ImpJ